MRSFFYSAVSISLLAAACGGDGSGPPQAGPPAALSIVSGGTQEGQAGQALSQPLSVKVVDAKNVPVAGRVVTFLITLGGGSLSAASDTTGADGVASVTWTLGPSVGASRTEAKVLGVLGAAVFNATIKAGPATAIQQVSGAVINSAAGFELPDSVSIRLADNFGNPIVGASVAFAVTGGGGSVSPATATTNAEGLAKANWIMGAGGAQALRVSSGALETNVTGTAATCNTTTIPVGGVLTLGPTDPRCIVLGGTAQRYLVTVVNTTASPSATGAFRVRGAGSGTGTTSGDVATATSGPGFSTLSASLKMRAEELRDHTEAHDELMRGNERVMRQMLTGGVAPSVNRRFNVQVQKAPPPNVGDTLNLTIPTNFANLCTGGTPVRARVVFVGQHGVMLEDVAAPLAGEADTLYRRVGQEFDTNMWRILNENFGNPLAMEGEPYMDNNERFFMLFSKVVNDLQGGSIAGYVSSSDFFPRTLDPRFGAPCPSSNQAEVFYARVPTVTGSGTGSGTSFDWHWRTRTVMMHEVKHIVSFAERIKRRLNAGTGTPAGFSEADRWLEESSAMLGEELWARTQFNYEGKTNVTYSASVGCEMRPNGSTNPLYANCVGKPISMFDHFYWLNNYLTNTEGLTPLGGVNSSDASFYGSGWHFLRWVVDTYAQSESAFLTAMTREINLPGTRNLEERTGRSFVDLVNEWSIAVATDDYPGFTPQNPKHRFPSWNTRDIYNGLNADFKNQGLFTRPVPLQIRPASFGKFTIDVSSVRGGSMSVFEITGTQANQQMFEFNGLAGSSFPADMRVNIIRVQ